MMTILKQWKVGDNVHTPYEEGIAKDHIVKVQDPSSLIELPELAVEDAQPPSPIPDPLHRVRSVEEIDRELDALEEGRQAMLEVECADLGIACNHFDCTSCLVRQRNEPKRPSKLNLRKTATAANTKSYEPCLACGAPTCHKHATKQFRKDDVTICNNCFGLFNWRIDPGDKLLARQVKNALQAYKCAYLLLESLGPSIPELTKKLNESSVRDSTVDLGSSSAGFLSGAMGFAGAATILTPVGAPLLLASTVLGASAFSTRFTYSIGKRFRRKKLNSLTNGIIAAFGILRAVLKTLTILVDDVNSEAEGAKKKGFLLPSLAYRGIEATKAANAGFQAGATVGATHSANVFQYLGTAPVIGQFFSVAVMTMELNAATRILARIRSGSPNEKADEIEHLMKQEFHKLPVYGEVRALVHQLLLFQAQVNDTETVKTC
jgi:hypothetical protein